MAFLTCCTNMFADLRNKSSSFFSFSNLTSAFAANSAAFATSMAAKAVLDVVVGAHAEDVCRNVVRFQCLVKGCPTRQGGSQGGPKHHELTLIGLVV